MAKQQEEVHHQNTRLIEETTIKSKRITELETKTTNLAATINQTQTELKHLGQEVLNVRREGLDALEARESVLVGTHRKQLEAMMAGYQSQINRQQAEAAKVEALHQEQKHILEDELRMAEERFQQRPARACDLDRIGELEALVVQQADQIG